MRDFLLRLAAVLSLVLWCAPIPQVAADDLADEADLHFRLGAERYTAFDYRGALEHFLASNRLVPNRNVIYNIARSYEKLERYAEAFRYYDLALAAETDPEAKQRIEQALAQIRPHVALLDIRTTPPGASIYLDRKDLGARGETPRALGLPAGRYTILVERPGYFPASKQLPDAAAGTTTLVELALRPILGTLRIEGSAIGAAVILDGSSGAAACTIPCSLDLPPGTHALRVELRGHKPAELGVNVVASSTVTLRPRLDAITGTALVTTDEPGALVSIDGQSRGFTPVVLSLPIGPHTLRLSARGYHDITREILIVAEQQQRLSESLPHADEVQAASRHAESVEDAPSSVTIIPREELLAFAYPTIADALQGVRGMYGWNDRSYASTGVRGLGVLGSYTNRELLLLDGHPTNDDWIGSAYVGFDARTDLADIERIEVVRGPGSVLYGTNAFSGVTNLVTRYRDESPGSEAGVSTADASVGRLRLRTQQSLGKDAGIWSSVSGAHGAGRDFFFPELSSGSTGGYSRGADGLDAGTVQGRVFWKWLTAQWFLHSQDKSLPTGEYGTLLGDPNTHQRDTRSFVELRAEPKLSDRVQLLSRVHWNLYQFRGQYMRTAADGGIEHDRFDGQWLGAEQRLVITANDALRFTLGAEGQLHYRVDARAGDDSGYFLNDSGAHQRTYQVGAAYGLVELSASQTLRLQGGLRLDAYSTFGQSWNPRAAVIWKPYARGNTKFLGGSAFRAPSIYELYYNDGGLTQIASPGLQPERMSSFEIEHSHKLSPLVTGIASVFTNYVTGLIVSRGTGDATDPLHYANSGSPLVSLGAELGVRREWRRGFMLEVSYGLQRSSFLASGSLSDLLSLHKDPRTRQVANSPMHLAALKAAAPLLSRGLTLATRLTLQGPRYDRYQSTSDPVQQATDVALIWDVVLSGHDDRSGVGYTVGAYNLADQRYATPVSTEFVQRTIRENGRTFLAGLDLKF
jgi:outer membrane receptor for ferrienterochelin and colicin